MNNDLISREALRKAIENYLAKRQDVIIWETDMFNMLDNAPTVEPTFKPIAEVKFDKEQLQEIVDKAKAEVLASIERPQGEWILQYRSCGDEFYTCSRCNRAIMIPADFSEIEIPLNEGLADYLYCPNCGADMRKGEEE